MFDYVNIVCIILTVYYFGPNNNNTNINDFSKN